MNTAFEQIVEFNKEAGFLNASVSPWLESAYQIEEALEGFDLAEIELRLFGTNAAEDNPTTAKQLARRILGGRDDNAISDLELLDKSLDAIVFAVGAIAKIGLNADQIGQALGIVMNCNFQKLRSKTYDSEGKLVKPDDFEGPEKELQKLLDNL